MSSQCPLCEGPLEGELLVAREMMFGMGGRFRYRRCVRCEALALLDVPEGMDPYSTRRVTTRCLSSRLSQGAHISHLDPAPLRMNLLLSSLSGW